MPVKTRTKKRQRRGAPWTEEEDARLLAIADLPPRVVADLMRRSWLACRRRLASLRADGSGSTNAPAERSARRP
jgi:class 3 adenylate cyclase